MKTSDTLIPLLISFFILLFTVPQVVAQNFLPGDYYYGVAPDDQPFFFNPVQVTPHSAGVFGEIMNQYSEQPLSAINRNPANITGIGEQNYFYFDVNTIPDEDRERQFGGCVNCITPGLIVSPSAISNQISFEPVLSTGLMIRPSEQSGLRVGFTYQLMRQNIGYYNVFSGSTGGGPIFFSSESSASFNIPEPSGPEAGERDQFRNLGHFPALYAGYEFSERISAGMKLAYSNFSGSGDWLVDEMVATQDASFPERINWTRDSDYSHWDLSAGVRAALSERAALDVTVGFLTGSFNQDGRNTSLQGFRNFFDDSDDFYAMDTDRIGRQDFIRDGNIFYAGTNLQLASGNRSDILFSYRISHSQQDYRYGSRDQIIREIESFSLNDDGVTVIFRNKTDQSQITSGDGESDMWNNRLGMFWNHQATMNTRFRTGLQFQMNLNLDSFNELSQDLTLFERVDEVGEEPEERQESRNDFRRDTDTDHNRYQLTGYLPVILERSFGDRFSAEIGVLGVYHSEIIRLNRVHDSEGLLLVRENGELVEDQTSSSTTESDMRMRDSQTFLNGFSSVTFSPVNQLNLRLSAFSDRRQLNTQRQVDDFRFQLSAEFRF